MILLAIIDCKIQETLEGMEIIGDEGYIVGLSYGRNGDLSQWNTKLTILS